MYGNENNRIHPISGGETLTAVQIGCCVMICPTKPLSNIDAIKRPIDVLWPLKKKKFPVLQ
jgi:hypothetical protein